MFELLYSSVAVTALNADELELLLSSSRAGNQLDGLTGCLLHVHDDDGRSAFFVQILEGEQEKVEAVYARIAADELHSRLMVLHSGPITNRRFSGWSMRLAELSTRGVLVAARQGGAASMGPAAGSGQAAGWDQAAGSGQAGSSVEAAVRDRRAMTDLLASYGESPDPGY